MVGDRATLYASCRPNSETSRSLSLQTIPLPTLPQKFCPVVVPLQGRRDRELECNVHGFKGCRLKQGSKDNQYSCDDEQGSNSLSQRECSSKTGFHFC
jgi:hypothetical protein